MNRFAPGSIAGFVLAGGRSSRMGTDKALALLGRRPLIQVALDTLAEAQIPARIAGSRSDLSAFAETVPDTQSECGPLGGVRAALAVSAADWNLFLPVDMPWMPASLLQYMLQRAMESAAPVAAIRRNGRIEPFPTVLHRAALPYLAQRIECGDASCHLAWQAIPKEMEADLESISIKPLVEQGLCRHPANLPLEFWFQSVNTPEELALVNFRALPGPQPFQD